MKIDHSAINASYFKEHPIIDYRNEDPSDLDISAIGHTCNPDFTSDNEFDLEAYCQCLVLKLHSLPIPVIRYFICHQCDKVKEPLQWINKLEILMDANHAIFIKDYPRYAKLQAVIETAREKFQDFQMPSEPKFDFNKFKTEIERLKTVPEKLIALKKEKTELLQHNLLNDNKLNTNFIEVINYEISYLIDLQHLESLESPKRPEKTANPLKFNGNTNVLADIFFQLMTTKGNGGKYLIEADIQDVAKFLSENFKDKDNNLPNTISLETMLRPNRSDKRPQGPRRIKILND